MASTFSLSMTKWSLDLATKLIKADVRLHNVETIQDDMAIIFTVNHFTRLETLLLPYIIHKHTGKEVWSLAAAELFKGKIGTFLQNTGVISNRDPDRDKTMVSSLLSGKNPWMIFPEGAMIKDKKVVDHAGELSIYNDGGRRAPHSGAAVLALRAEYYRHKLECIYNRDGGTGLAPMLERFQLEDVKEVLKKRTVIIPVNITYFPMRARDNFMLRMASRFAQDLSKRALEELSVEGTVLSDDTDIDIRLGEPIDVHEYLNAPEFAEVMACGLNDMDAFEEDPKSLFQDAARKLMDHYMRSIYKNTTINYDHIFATLIRHQPPKGFTERMYRNRIFLCAHEIKKLGYHNLHSLLERTYKDVVFEDPSPKFQSFIALSLKEKFLLWDGDKYTRNLEHDPGHTPFHHTRFHEMTNVIANEIEPLERLTRLIRQTARMPRFLMSKRIRDIFLAEDQELFESDYTQHFDVAYSKGADVGRPFLLKPMRVKGGVVLAHGYMAAPLEIRALAEYLCSKGYAVYGVRLRGHGTAPADLAKRTWEEWYESFNRGYAIIKSLTDNIILGGFSTGGCMALMAAARKGIKIQACFSICAPLQVRNYSVRLVPGIVAMNSVLKRMGRSPQNWEYVENVPENVHINYTQNPLTGVAELVKVMNKTEELLSQVQVPTLVLQGSDDTVVNASSAQQIFDGIGSTYKEMTLLGRHRHGIVNGAGREEVFHKVYDFLKRAPQHETVQQETAEDAETAVVAAQEQRAG